jgi:putative membrane protein
MRISGPIIAALGAALTIVLSTPVQSQQSGIASGDSSRITRAAQMGLAEVASSKVAMEKATKPEVKKFAEHMVKEHQDANSELQQIASSKGVTMPTSPDAKHQEALKKLRGMSGDKFDREYMERSGVKDHKAALSLFQEGAKNAKDPQLKAYFEKHVPHIKQHLAMAQDISGQADGGDGTKKKAGSGSGARDGASGSASK